MLCCSSWPSFQVQICKITHFFPGAKTHVATKLLFFTKNFQSSNLESRMKKGHKNWGFKTYCNSKKLDLITGENLRSVCGHRGWSINFIVLRTPLHKHVMIIEQFLSIKPSLWSIQKLRTRAISLISTKVTFFVYFGWWYFLHLYKSSRWRLRILELLAKSYIVHSKNNELWFSKNS